MLESTIYTEQYSPALMILLLLLTQIMAPFHTWKRDYNNAEQAMIMQFNVSKQSNERFRLQDTEVEWSGSERNSVLRIRFNIFIIHYFFRLMEPLRSAMKFVLPTFKD